MLKYLKVILISLIISSLLLGLISNVFAQKATAGIRIYNSPRDYQRATGKKITKYSEAPMLTELVKQGKILPVEKRLPLNPIVIEPLEEIGQYGGVWRSVWKGTADSPAISNHTRYIRLVRFKGDLSGLEPDIAESWSVTRDSKEFTFRIRKGIKWSDGQPFTVDDIIFWYEDILLNKDLTPTFPKWLTVSEKPMKIEKVDNYTFKVIFSEPYALFLLTHASRGGFIESPRHYLMQFHPRYTPIEKLQELIKKEGFQNWTQLFDQKASWLQNPELPVLTAWKVISPPDATGRVVMERNPYFYKIDSSGNQLPYIDKIIWEMFQSQEVAIMKAISGEIDLHIRHFRASDYTILAENREKGKYRTILYYEDRGGDDYATLYLNQNVKDPILRNLFRDKRFRVAISLALNREEINNLVYLGLGKPRQASMPSSSPYYDPEWEKAYAEYNPEMSNKLLDEIGLIKRDKDGFRLRPDGKTLELLIETVAGPTPPDTLELIKKYLEKIGIKVLIKTEERSLYTTRCAAGEVQVGSWGAFAPSIVIPDHLLAIGPSSFEAIWAPLWGQWYLTKGKAGEEPPKEMKQIFKLWERIKATPSTKERDRLFKEICRIHKENLWIIGTVGEPPRVGVIKENFRNVGEKAPYGGIAPTPACTLYPEQFFIKK